MHDGSTSIHVVWTSGASDNLSAAVLVDLSAANKGYTSQVVIKRITGNSTAAVAAVFEIDCTSNQLVAATCAGQTDFDFDFRDWPDGGYVKTAAGSTGDLVVTTTHAADGQEMFLKIDYRVR
jgi:hypothetical protein